LVLAKDKVTQCIVSWIARMMTVLDSSILRRDARDGRVYVNAVTNCRIRV